MQRAPTAWIWFWNACQRNDPTSASWADTMIELENVSKKYGNKLAVDDLNLRIEGGELFAFLGPNGAGKTTTIKMMCGLLFPSGGRIRIAGFSLAEEGEKARRVISYVPGQPFLDENLTG